MLLILFNDTPRTKPYKLTVRSTLGFCLINSGGVKSSNLSTKRNKIKLLHDLLTACIDFVTSEIQCAKCIYERANYNTLYET